MTYAVILLFRDYFLVENNNNNCFCTNVLSYIINSFGTFNIHFSVSNVCQLYVNNSRSGNAYRDASVFGCLHDSVNYDFLSF